MRAAVSGGAHGAAMGALLLAALLLGSAPAGGVEIAPLDPPPSPYVLLGSRPLRTPPIDVVPFCVAEELPDDLKRFAEHAAGGEPQAALEALKAWRAARRPLAAEAVGPSAETAKLPAETARLPADTARLPADTGLVAAALEARAAADDEEARQGAARVLADAIAAGGSEAALACARLEAARLALLRGRLPEAAAHAVQAGRLRARLSDPSAVGEAADFYRAEARHLSGANRDALPLYKVLIQSARPRMAAAARLRLADVSFDLGRPADAHADYETLLARSESFGVQAEAWALRAGEAALAQGELGKAEDWLRRALQAPLDTEAAAAATLRLGDVLALLGRGAESRELLLAFASGAADADLAELARVRAVDLGVAEGSREERLEALRHASRSTRRSLAVYARAVLGHLLVQYGETDEALDVLARLAYDAPPKAVGRHLQADLDAALAAAASAAATDADCAELVTRLGERRALLARHASDPAPFLRLGDCYMVVGLPESALAVYRALTRSFGTRLGRDISLQVARAALKSGDVAVARATAAAGVRQSGPEQIHWRVLLAEAELYDGKWSRAAEALEGLVAAGEPADDPLRAISVLARAAARLPDSGAHPEVLAAALERLGERERRARPADFGEAALLTAEMERRAGRIELALELYATASEALPPGLARAEAAYWLGALHPDPLASRAALERAAGTPGGGPWSRLAESELGLGRVREQLGREPQPPAEGGA